MKASSKKEGSQCVIDLRLFAGVKPIESKSRQDLLEAMCNKKKQVLIVGSFEPR